jgi:Plasmid pRiA4b ORF-3-like protein
VCDVSAGSRAQQAAVYQLKITLKNVKPPVWRRVLVSGGTTLAQLHDLVQDAMGWTDSHLHLWEVGGRQGQRYGVPDPDLGWEDMRDERRAKLSSVAARGDRFAYWYDFGDDWWHDVLVEDVRPKAPGEDLPRCIAGRRACPPEDVGGPWGYADFLEAYGDPEHPRHEELIEWAGPGFDPATFQLEEIDGLLRRR